MFRSRSHSFRGSLAGLAGSFNAFRRKSSTSTNASAGICNTRHSNGEEVGSSSSRLASPSSSARISCSSPPLAGPRPSPQTSRKYSSSCNNNGYQLPACGCPSCGSSSKSKDDDLFLLTPTSEFHPAFRKSSLSSTRTSSPSPDVQQPPPTPNHERLRRCHSQRHHLRLNSIIGCTLTTEEFETTYRQNQTSCCCEHEPRSTRTSSHRTSFCCGDPPSRSRLEDRESTCCFGGGSTNIQLDHSSINGPLGMFLLVPAVGHRLTTVMEHLINLKKKTSA